MTEQELREKIVEIAISTVWKDCYGDEVVIDRAVAEQFVNALIAAGLKFDTIVSHTATFDLMQQEQINRLERRCAQAEHRAARAERALQIADELGELCGRKEDYVQQAEKELAEERKDD